MKDERNPEDVLRELREPDYWQGLRTPRSGRSTRAASRFTAVRVLPAIAALVIAVLAVTGIAVGFGSLHRDGVPAATSTPSRTPEVISSPSTAPPAFTGVVPGASRTYDAEHEPPTCTLDQLQLSADKDGGGAAGTYIHALYVRNSGTPCTLPTDLVHVGTTSAPIRSRLGFLVAGGVLDPGDVAQLVVAAAEGCGPQLTVNNIDRAHPEPISLRSGGALQATTATFPRTSCSAPYVDASLDTDHARRFGTTALTAMPSPVTYSDGESVQYSMELRYSGAAPIVLEDCPRAIETIRDAGDTVTRSLTLTCAVGATLQPGATSTVRVTVPVPVPFANGITVAWFIPQVSTSGSAVTTCTLAQLHFASDGEMGGEVGNFFGHFRVRNTGSACALPVGALTIGGRAATGRSGELALAGHATSTVLMTAAQRGCGTADAANISGAVTSGQPDAARYEKPIVVSLGGRKSVLPVLYPILACSPASIELQAG